MFANQNRMENLPEKISHRTEYRYQSNKSMIIRFHGDFDSIVYVIVA